MVCWGLFDGVSFTHLLPLFVLELTVSLIEFKSSSFSLKIRVKSTILKSEKSSVIEPSCLAANLNSSGSGVNKIYPLENFLLYKDAFITFVVYGNSFQ